MRVAITGATGLVGRHLVDRLLERGDEVVAFTRNVARTEKRLPEGVAAARWETTSPNMIVEVLAETDAVVHLAGEPVLGRRWSQKVKDAIRSSRVEGARTLVGAMGMASARPKVLVSASATGFYGPRGPDDVVDEEAIPGYGFLSHVSRDWETQAKKAEALGIRVAIARIGIVLTRKGGALARMRLPFRLFLGGRIGNGRQGFPWIHVDDLTGILLHALDGPEVRGTLNACAPSPVSNRDFCRTLGKAMRRPSWLPVPGPMLRLFMGEVAGLLTTGQYVVPKRTLESGYEFAHPELEGALADLLRKD